MKRRSRLSVLIRLARLNENRALHRLGEARSLAESTRSSLQSLEGQIDSTWAGSVLARAGQLDAGGLASNDQRTRGLGLQADALKETLTSAREAEENARAAVVDAKLRLRTLRSAAAKREAQERQLQRRAEIRRMDESRRGMRSDEDS